MNRPAQTILILAANPRGTSELRLGEEVRGIEDGLRRAQKRDEFVIKQRWATTPLDMQRAMLDEKPNIVHFCGHGAGEKGLVFEDKNGRPKPVTGKALARLFRRLSDQVSCVLLNACHSQTQAKAIAQHIDTVIGMSQAVGDQAALKFATGFYDALGAGRDVEFAYDWGCTAIEMEGIDEALTPVLLHNPSGETASQAATIPAPSASSGQSGEGSRTAAPKIFISYKRDIATDEQIAQQLYGALHDDYEVFIDRNMPVGTNWMERINQEIERSDILIVLLSEASVRSEMVLLEIEKAHHQAQQTGLPRILPVRVAYQAPFTYPLSEYLNPINWAFWRDEADTPGLITEIQQAVQGHPLSLNTERSKAEVLVTPAPTAFTAPAPMAQPAPLEKPEGTMRVQSSFYVERPDDRVALETIAEEGVTLTIKGARQMGKSSLLIRVMDAARAAGKQVAFLDFQLFDKATLDDADDFFYQFCLWMTDTLDLDDRVDEYWQRPQGNRQRCTRYFRRHLLPQLEKPLVLAMDEVESIFDTPFRTDFFGMLRNWHNERATSDLWRQCDLALVTSTEPYQLIDNLNQSPFNVGEVLDLSDFALAQVQDLNQRHGGPLSEPQVEELMALVNGHPYLVRRALYLVASERMSAAELFEQAAKERGPFGDHLRYHLFRIYDKPELVSAFLQVIRKQRCPDEHLFFRLRGAGLIRRSPKGAVPRCQLYARYFQEHLSGG
ncbi:MAG: AAA-like domain-containing protein [Cyanobacteria bacterium P01_F01_bin.3]